MTVASLRRVNRTVYQAATCRPTTAARTTCRPRATSFPTIPSSWRGVRGPQPSSAKFADEGCADIVMGFGYPASSTCVGGYNETEYTIARLNKDGSASIEFYPDRSCSSATLNSVKSGDKTALATHDCDGNWVKWYSSNDVEDVSAPLSKKTQAAHSAPVGAFIFVTVFVVVVVARKRKAKPHETTDHSRTLLQLLSAASLEKVMRGQSGLWSDEMVIAKRIPRDKVLIGELISQGSFGEVYAGVFNGQQVAVKTLLPASRDNLQYVNEFLAEAKMTATMDHPQIVSFVGVAWDSLSDLCVVLEYMDGGELHALLNEYADNNRPVGFDRQKATIALQVCQALAYLHSLVPSVIHRDLKSRNILLDSGMQAKLSDFGISRERLDRTMTAGVGTSLWMAPEVMLGERYDDKVDMFSFGVVLSELDVHTLPYARARKEVLDSNGRELADSVLLQKVALGTIQVKFTSSSPRSIAELGRACVSIDPTVRLAQLKRCIDFR